MKPNDKAIEAAATSLFGNYMGGEKKWIGDALTAAYAAQFQSEDYAGLVKWLRDKAESLSEIYPPEAEAADAIEAVLAERDDFAEQIALRSENGISKDLQEFLRKFKEDDSAAIRMFAQYRDLEIEMDSWKSLWEKTNAHMRQVEAELDALAARLAPVEDEALVEIAAYYFTDGSSWSNLSERLRNICRRDARNVIAAIRPHIEAAERERCAKVADKQGWCAGSAVVCGPEIAAAIRSGK